MWRMLTAVHVHGMRHLTYGWRHLERTLTFLRVRAKSDNRTSAPDVRSPPPAPLGSWLRCVSQRRELSILYQRIPLGHKLLRSLHPKPQAG